MFFSYIVVMLITVSSFIYPTVQPVVDGEGIWNVVSRIGETTDIIESKVCDLEFQDTVLPDCDFLITQSDIGDGGTLVLTQTGKYCLAESVFIANDPGITIAGSNIHLDLNGHTIVTACFIDSAILINRGSHNIIIENGIIRGQEPTYLNNGILVDFFFGDIDVTEITVKNIEFTNVSGTGVSFTRSESIVIENCRFSGLDFNDDGGNSNAAIELFSCRNVVVNNCFAEGFFLGAAYLDRSENIVYRNTIARRGTNGFFISSCDQVCLENCSVYDTGSDGFLIQSKNVFLDRCLAQGTFSPIQAGAAGYCLRGNSGNRVDNITLRDCVATDCATAYDFRGSFVTNITFDRCSAQGFMDGGFLIKPSTSSNFRFVNCTAKIGDTSGFFVNGSNLSNISFDRCSSLSNDGDGFSIGANPRNVVLNKCSAIGNTGDGIDDQTGGLVRMLGCIALDNGASDIMGATDATLLISKSTPGELAAGNRWLNVIS